MNITCSDRERIFLDGTPEEWTALEAHSGHCPACSEELAAWRNLSQAASELHEEWDSPALWPRIERALVEQSAAARTSWWQRLLGSSNLFSLTWQTAAAGLVLVLFSASALWVILHRNPAVPTSALLTDRAVGIVEEKQAAYEEAIDKLDAQARPQLDQAATPLMASYREKLQVLDSAIADLKSQAGMNPANGHLRRQLLAMYQEKQLTLEEILEPKRP
jgi:anti-sigma factor RsiW